MTTDPDCSLIAELVTPTPPPRTAPEAATDPPHPPAAPRRTGGCLKLRSFDAP